MSALAFVISANLALAEPGQGPGPGMVAGDENLRWVASPAVSSVHEPFGVLFEPRYADLAGGAVQRDVDLDALRADLPGLDEAVRAAGQRQVRDRLTAVRHWQQEFAALIADPSVDPSRRRVASDIHQRLALEASTLELQLGMLSGNTGRVGIEAALAPTLRPPTLAPRTGQDAPNSHDEKTAIGHDLWIAPGETVGTAVVVGGTLRIEGRVRDAVAVMGDVVLMPGGVIEGDSVVVLGNLHEPGATHEPAADHASAGSVGAAVSPPTPPEPRARLRGAAPSGGAGSTAVSFLTLLGLGAVAAGAFPAQLDRVSGALERRPGWSFVLGAIGVPGLLLASTLLALTLVGAPVAVVLVALLGTALVLGMVAVSQSVADHLPIAWPHTRWAVLATLALALSAITALPWFAQLVLGGSVLLGTGAALGSRLGRAG